MALITISLIEYLGTNQYIKFTTVVYVAVLVIVA